MAVVEVPVEAVDALEGALTEMEGWSQMLAALGPDAMGWLDGEWLELLARTVDRWVDGARPVVDAAGAAMERRMDETGKR